MTLDPALSDTITLKITELNFDSTFTLKRKIQYLEFVDSICLAPSNPNHAHDEVNFVAYSNLCQGIILYENGTGNLDSAEGKFRKIETVGFQPVIQGQKQAALGYIYFSRNEPDSAIHFFKNALELISDTLQSPSYYLSTIQFKLGNCLAELKRFEEAVEVLVQAVLTGFNEGIACENYSGFALLINLLHKQGDHESVHYYGTQYLNTIPFECRDKSRFIGVADDVTIALLAEEEYEFAIELMSQILQYADVYDLYQIDEGFYDPRRISHFMFLAQAYHGNGDLDLAKSWYQGVLKEAKQPSLEVFRKLANEGLAEVFSEKGHFDSAYYYQKRSSGFDEYVEKHKYRNQRDSTFLANRAISTENSVLGSRNAELEEDITTERENVLDLQGIIVTILLIAIVVGFFFRRRIIQLLSQVGDLSANLSSLRDKLQNEEVKNQGFVLRQSELNSEIKSKTKALEKYSLELKKLEAHTGRLNRSSGLKTKELLLLRQRIKVKENSYNKLSAELDKSRREFESVISAREYSDERLRWLEKLLTERLAHTDAAPAKNENLKTSSFDYSVMSERFPISKKKFVSRGDIARIERDGNLAKFYDVVGNKIGDYHPNTFNLATLIGELGECCFGRYDQGKALGFLHVKEFELREDKAKNKVVSVFILEGGFRVTVHSTYASKTTEDFLAFRSNFQNINRIS